jgi:hypothetical protein
VIIGWLQQLKDMLASKTGPAVAINYTFNEIKRKRSGPY